LTVKKQEALHYSSVPTSQGDLLVPYEFHRSRKAKSVRLSIGWKSQVVITVPWRFSYEEGVQFLLTQGDWVKKHLDHTHRSETISEYYMKQPFWNAYNKKWRLQIQYQGKQARYRLDQKTSSVDIKLNRDKNLELQLMLVTRRFASQVLEERTKELAQYTNLIPSSIRIGNQATRWGSCSQNRTISLNWRLLLIPFHLQDHIILHELAHLQEMNHSRNFYKLLKKLDENSEVNNNEVKNIGSKIMRLGRI
jgi:predicted metal-dependent hydrolase